MKGLPPETTSALEQKHPPAYHDSNFFLFFLLQMHLLVLQKLKLLGQCKVFQMDQLGGQTGLKPAAHVRSHLCFCGECG